MRMILVCAMIFGMLATVSAHSADLTLSWDAPTKRADGSPLLLEEIKGYEVKDGNDVIAVVALSYNVLDVNAGERCFQVRTVDTEDRKSEYSHSACGRVKGAPGKVGAPKVTVVYVTTGSLEIRVEE